MDNGMGHGDTPMAPGSMSTDGSAASMTKMHTVFFWGREMEILFHGFPNGDLGLYVLSLFFVFLLAVAVEGLTVVGASKASTKPRAAWVARSGLHALRMGLAYLIMLSVMSYNAGIFFVTIAGHGVGFLLFRRPAAPQALNERAISSNTAPMKV